MKSKSYQIPSVGEIIIAKHPNSKRITLKLRPNQPPKVVIPQLMSFKVGVQFACEKTDWIIEHTKKIIDNEANKIIYNNLNNFKTRYTTICFIANGKRLKAEQKNNIINLIFPENTNFENIEIQKTIKKFIVEILRREAKKHLVQQTEKFAAYFNFKINKVYIKNLKTRWGSCSSTNNINLNVHLMRLPEHLSDFIILHELCHTVHKNHGSRFHDLLNTITDGKEKILNTELKRYTIEL